MDMTKPSHITCPYARKIKKPHPKPKELFSEVLTIDEKFCADFTISFT